MKRILHVLICAACIPVFAYAQLDIVPFQNVNAKVKVILNNQ